MATSITKPARSGFAPEQVQMLKRTVAKNCDDSEFVLFLETVARLDLNPLMGEAYAAKMPGRNGGSGQVVVIVGRNGLLKIAKRDPEYLGVDSDVVRQKDIFRVKRSREGREIIHEYEGSAEQRGPVVGAWAEVKLRTRENSYYFAPLSEYMPTSEAKLRHSPWGAQESVMISKCAIIAALRHAIDIGGVFDEAELARMAAESAPASSGVHVDWGDETDEGLAMRLRMLIDAANQAKPGFWRDGKVAARLNGASEEQRLEFARELEDWILNAGGEIPDPPVDGEVVSEEEVSAA